MFNYEKRLSEIRDFMKENEIGACLVSQPDNQYYFSGFSSRNYSRPIIVVILPDKSVLIVPALDEKPARAKTIADELCVYYEVPEKAVVATSYLDHLDKLLAKLPSGTRIGSEFQFINLALVNHLKNYGFEMFDIGPKIAHMRMIKDKEEIEALMEAGDLVNIGMTVTLANVRVGISETELDQVGTDAVFKEAKKRYPDVTLGMRIMTPSGPDRSGMPHVNSSTRKLEEGDVAIHSRHVIIYGYMSELERTFFVGEPSSLHKELFEIVYNAQQAGIDMLAPGVMGKEIDSAARKVIQDAGYGEYFVHRTGHGIGLTVHEGPYLRFDSDTILEEGMVVTVEPAVYIPKVGGFRHSDTFIITRDGKKALTSYPRELKDLILKA